MVFSFWEVTADNVSRCSTEVLKIDKLGRANVAFSECEYVLNSNLQTGITVIDIDLSSLQGRIVRVNFGQALSGVEECDSR